MQYALLGRNGIRASRICLGTMTFGNPVTEAQACDLVHHALDHGLNFFDAANVYEGYDRTFGSEGGVGENVLGKALEGRRHQAVICTKFGNPVGLGLGDAGLSARHLEVELTRSLRRLRTDWIDLVLAHRWDPSVAVEEVWRVMDGWVRAGKVRCIGVSNWPVWRMAQACELAKQNGWAPVAASSPLYNLLRREAEAEHLPCAHHYGIGVVSYQPFMAGILTGKYRRGQAAAAGSRGAEKPGWLPPMDDALYDKLEAMELLAREAGVPLVEYVVAWLLARPQIASIIAGCRTSQQLDALIAGVDRCIPAEHLQKIDSIFPPPRPAGGTQVLQWKHNKWVLADFETCP